MPGGTPPGLTGVLETALYVDDLERGRDFYQRIMGLTPIHQDERMSAYDIGGHSVFLLFKRGESAEGADTPGGFIPPHDGAGPLHVAFSVAPDALLGWERRLVGHGIAIESRVTWPRGGMSLYFRDPEDHLIELATPGLWPGF